MYIQVLISRETAIIAVAHTLQDQQNILSKLQFTRHIKRYSIEWGRNALMRHSEECAEFIGQATEIVNKYYK
jgi:hypothetical protein